MDIFKLGDKILALLEAVFGFWNNQISLVFAMLGQSPVSFKGGGPWAVIEGIEPVFVAVGSSLVVLFFVIGFCSESCWSQARLAIFRPVELTNFRTYKNSQCTFSFRFTYYLMVIIHQLLLLQFHICFHDSCFL